MARTPRRKEPVLKSVGDDKEFSAPVDSDSSPLLTRRETARQRHVSLKQLATLLNRDRNTVMRYLDQDMPYVEKTDRDRGVQWVLDIAGCVGWLEERAAKNVSERMGGGSDNLPSLDVIEQRTKAARMYTAEAEMAETIGVVARIHDVLGLIKRDYAELRIRLMAVSEAVSAKFDDKTTDRVRVAISEQIASALLTFRADADVEKIQALIKAVKAGILSRTQATAEMGLNTFEIDLHNAEEFQRSSALGLFYSIFDGEAEKAAAIQSALAANDNKDADVPAPALTLKEFLEQYTQAVRAGTITPQPEDEATVRSMFGLPAMSPDVASF